MAETHRTNALTRAPAPAALRLAAAGSNPDLAFASRVTHLDEDMLYEPRSLALSPGLTRLAVGTKAGRLLVFERDEQGGAWTAAQLPALSVRLAHGRDDLPPWERKLQAARAIRALCFHSEDRLVAGRGVGEFLVLDREQDGWKLESALFRPSEESPIQPATARRLRLRRLVPLPTGGDHGFLTLAFTGGFEAFLLSRASSGVLEVHQVSLTQLFRAGNESPDALRRLDLRIGDAALAMGFLWYLTAGGGLLRCAVEVAEGALTLRCDAAWHLEPPFREAEFRRLVGCEYGLAVLTANGVTFLRFARDAGTPTFGSSAGHDRDDPLRSRLRPSWIDVRDATDCAVCLPYDERDGRQPVHCRSLSGRDPVWVAVATAEPGLRWFSWHDREEGGEASVARIPVSGPSTQHSVGRAGEPVLCLAFGTLRNPREALLASATRDHRVYVSTILDRYRVFHALRVGLNLWLDGQSETLRASAGLPEQLRTQGIAYWILMRRIDRDFALERGGAPFLESFDPMGGFTLACKNEPHPAFRDALALLDEADLRRMGNKVIRRYGALASSGGGGERLPLLRVWILRILERCNELSSTLGRELCEGLYGNLIELLSHQEQCDGGSDGLALFADFLQKWFVRGHTYGRKRSNLLRLLKYNLECDRGLDALAYLAPLFRRRVDLSWKTIPAEPRSSETVIDLIHDVTGRLIITSHLSGALRITHADGEAVPWSVDPGVDLSRAHLELREDGLTLERRRSREYLLRYRHGPYARQLLAIPDVDGEFLLVFALRGWRLEDHDVDREGERQALLCILRLRCDPVRHAVEILAAASVESPSELYALADLGKEGEEVRILVGTSGTWRIDNEWVRQPFVEARILVSGGELGLRLCHTEVTPYYYERSVPTSSPTLPHTVQNACLRIAVQRAEGRTWVWAGYRDGQIQCLRPDTTPGDARASRWTEVQGLAASGGEGAECLLERFELNANSFNNLSAITSLRHIAWHDHHFLVFGTRGGVVGALSLHRDGGHTDFEALGDGERQGGRGPAAEDPTPRGILRRVRGAWPLLLHKRLPAGICGVDAFEDEGRRRLAVLSEDGTVALFDLERRTTGDGRSNRPTVPGELVDRFPLDHPARALAFAPAGSDRGGWLFDSKLPEFVVGGVDGSVYRYSLTLPQRSERRKTQAVGLARGLRLRERKEPGLGRSTTPHLRDIVGGDWMRDWIRIIDIDNDHMLRYALWVELHEKKRELLDELDRLDANGWSREEADDLYAGLKAFRELLVLRVEAIYRRRPLRREPAKILWEEGSKVANRLAESLFMIDDGPLFERTVNSYLDLVTCIDDFCNQWIGAAQSEEARVLAHSFSCLFDWQAIVLLSWRRWDGCLNPVRSFLTDKLASRRLTFAQNEMLPLETMEAINLALFRSILKRELMAKEEKPVIDLTLKRGRRPGEEQDAEGAARASAVEAGQDRGLYDLLVLIGDLAERNGKLLTPSAPLTTELYRFFGLCLLLIPGNAVVLGQIVSESRLMDSGREASGGILAHAEITLQEIARKAGKSVADYPLWILAMSRFTAYSLTEDVPEERSKDVLWRHLFAISEDDSVPKEPYTDRDLMKEYERITCAARVLASLEERDLSPDEKEAMSKLARWGGRRSFSLSEATWEDRRFYRFFAHSSTVLKELERRREGILTALADQSETRLRKARELCDHARAYLENEPGLFEPQRTQFRALIERWRQAIDRRAAEAIEILEMLKTFNRHVYRTDADHQIGAACELARQVAPVWYDEESDEGIQRIAMERDLESQPLIGRIVSRAKRMVDNTHLAGTLLAVASRSLSSDPRIVEEVSLRQVAQTLQEAALHRGLSGFEWDTEGPAPEDAVAVPGSRATWEVICHEVAQNVMKYCAGLGLAPSRRLLGSLRLAGTDERSRGELELYGEVPFRFCVDPELLDGSGPTELVGLLHELAGRALAPGKRLSGRASPASSGMGLDLLRRIAQFSGMRLSTRLAAHAGIAPLESPFAVAIAWGPPQQDQGLTKER